MPFDPQAVSNSAPIVENVRRTSIDIAVTGRRGSTDASDAICFAGALEKIGKITREGTRLFGGLSDFAYRG